VRSVGAGGASCSFRASARGANDYARLARTSRPSVAVHGNRPSGFAGKVTRRGHGYKHRARDKVDDLAAVLEATDSALRYSATSYGGLNRNSRSAFAAIDVSPSWWSGGFAGAARSQRGSCSRFPPRWRVGAAAQSGDGRQSRYRASVRRRFPRGDPRARGGVRAGGPADAPPLHSVATMSRELAEIVRRTPTVSRLCGHRRRTRSCWRAREASIPSLRAAGTCTRDPAWRARSSRSGTWLPTSKRRPVSAEELRAFFSE